MKKFLHLFILLISFSSAFAQSKDSLLPIATKVLYTKISYMDQPDFNQDVYAELAYLKRVYHLDSFRINNSRYISSLNDYYYKRFYLYSKLLDENAVVTEDCFSDDANARLNSARKLIFYTLYPNSIKLPENIVDQIEEYATVDEFWGPYNSLNIIYFLKKYNYQNLSSAQKTKLASVEKFLSDLMYNKYIKDKKKWDFYKFLSLKVLKMNNIELAKNIDISDLVIYITHNYNKPFVLSEEDRNDMALMNKVGYKNILEYEVNAFLWIFLLELNKK